MKNNPPLNLKWLFFSFKGRIARQSFILAQLLLLIVLIFIIRQIVIIEIEDDPRLWKWGLVLLIALLGSAYCSLTLGVKRLHDLNLPWITVLLIFVPFLNTLFILFLMIKPSYSQKNEHGNLPFGNSN